MLPFLSQIHGQFDGLFGSCFGKDGVTVAIQAYDLGRTKKYKWACDGSICESTNLLAQGEKINGFTAINRYIPVFKGTLDTPYHKAWFAEAKERLAKNGPSGPRPDKCVQTNSDALNALKRGREKPQMERKKAKTKVVRARGGLEGRDGP